MTKMTRGFLQGDGEAGGTAAALGVIGGRSVLVAGATVALCLIASMPAAAQFSATPVILEMETADSAETRTIRVRNEGAGELPMRFYAGDFEQDPAGAHRFMRAGEHERSCSERLHLFPEGARLQPGETVEVIVRLEPGPESCWSAVFAETTRPSGGGLAVAQRIAVKVYGSSVVGTRAAEVRGVTRQGDELLVDVANTGERAFVASGELEIRSLEGEVLAVVPLQEFSVLPDHNRAISITLPADLATGRYLAIPIVDFGGDFLAGGQALIDIEQEDP